MANFDVSFDKVVRKWEGLVLECVAGDLGGETCCGIARKIHPNWFGWTKIDAMKAKGKVEISNVMTEVMEFYQAWYAPLDKVHDQKIADQIFQGYVNCGSIGKKWAQMVANGLLDCKLVIDGIIGLMTLGALNRLTAAVFCKPYRDMQVSYYDGIVDRYPTQQKFLAGWHARADDFL